MDCPNCGYPLEPHEAFCSNCGHYVLPLQGQSIPVVAPPPNASADGRTVVAPSPSIPGDSAPGSDRGVAQRLYPPAPQTPPAAYDGPYDDYPEPASYSHTKMLKRLKILSGILGAAAVISIAVTVYILVTTSSLRVQMNKAQKESLTSQSNAAELETQVSSLAGELSSAKAENTELTQQISQLTTQLENMETSVNQNQYDKKTLEHDLEQAKTDLAAATESNSTLEAELTETRDSLAAAQEEAETLKTENKTLSDKVSRYESEISFYDSHVVFVMLGNSEKQYHRYSCPHFTQRNFLSYSVKLAEANGYSPCPDCIGTQENDGETEETED